MKRPQCAVMIKDQAGVVTQHSIYKSSKEAKKTARELALEKVRNGMQTKVHTDVAYIFPDGYEVYIRKVYEDGTYYGKENGETVRKVHEFPMAQ
jgi:hypothetical protein